MKSNRLEALEAMRGLAALIVVLYHALMAFWDPVFKLVLGTPFFLFFSGDAAVAFFFVLSGSVNCRSLHRTPTARNLARGLLKRWPRLLVPTLLATLFSWSLYAAGLYRFEEAGALTGSHWLATLANGATPGFVPSFADALYSGTIGAFVSQGSHYDPPLWTMHFELVGSVAVMILAWVTGRMSLRNGLIATLLGAVLIFQIAPYFTATFIAGMTVSFVLLRRGDRPAPDNRMMAGAMALAVYLLSYAYPTGMHAWIYDQFDSFWRDMESIALHSVGAVVLVYAGYTWGPLLRLLSGRWAVTLGELSLPIFLLHVPVFGSVSSWILLEASPVIGLENAKIVAFVAALAVTLPLSMLFVRLDRAGGTWITKTIDQLLTRCLPVAATQGV